jgi:hypothetical protein
MAPKARPGDLDQGIAGDSCARLRDWHGGVRWRPSLGPFTAAHGFKVRLVAPQFVKPYVKSNENDANDAEAICEAMSRPHMRFVPVKTVLADYT